MKSQSSTVKFSIADRRAAPIRPAAAAASPGERDARLPAVPAPFLVAQISDPHIGAAWHGEDPIAGLREVVDAVAGLADRPDAVLVSGDLTEHGDPAEYATVRELLDPLGAPVHAIGGNHDDRATLRAAFELPGQNADPVQWAVDLGSLRMIGLDTNIAGSAAGALDAERLRWLDAELARAPDQPTLLAMHHPPIMTGVAPWDAIGLPPGDQAALARVLDDHPQVRRVVSGHVHQTITASIAGRPVLTIPSTYVQGRLNFDAAEIELAPDEPRGFAVHALVGRDVVSYVRTLR
jgi:3',5'-cyclic-AMP phosphodiesterase